MCLKSCSTNQSVQPQVGQEIEVRPGIVSKDQDGKLMCKPIFSKIVSLFAEHNDLQYAAPGGLIGKCTPTYYNTLISMRHQQSHPTMSRIKEDVGPIYSFGTGVGTKIDPTLCRADRMVGQVLGAVGALPEIFTELEISYFLLRRLLGVRTEGDKKAAKVRAGEISVTMSFPVLPEHPSTSCLHYWACLCGCRSRSCPRMRC